MDLNKDSKNVYSVDAETYSEFMHENWEKPTNFLNSFIKILLVILLLVVGYFYYRISKENLSFSEVFNKKELDSAYALLKSDDKDEMYLKVLAKAKVAIEEVNKSSVEKPKVTKVVVESIKKEIPVEIVKPVKIIEKIETTKIEQPIHKVTEEKKIEVVETEIKKEIVEEVVTVELSTPKEKTTSEALSESYLDRMVEELNSI